jgi:hypothetical protein
VLSYDEEGRLVRISRLQNGVTTPLFEYGYGYDGARRWRKDLASNVWDWYPCGVACCAGDLATLRSTDGGATWSVLERRLDKAPVVNGEPFLGSLGSGTQRIGAEAALTDALGVLRGGAYGPGLNSLLNPLRGDAGVEETLRKLHAPLSTDSLRAECYQIYRGCILQAMGKYTACIAAVVVVGRRWAAACRAIAIPKLQAACWTALGIYLVGAMATCYLIKQGAMAECRRALRRCLAEINAEVKAVPVAGALPPASG